MGKGIYTYYKERLIEIGGNSKCLYLKNVSRRGTYDIGRIFEGREDKISALLSFLYSGAKAPLTLISEGEKEDIIKNLDGAKTQKKTRADIEGAPSGSTRKQKAVEDIIPSEIAKIREIKREVEEIEREVLMLTDDGTACYVSDDKGAYLVKLIEERKNVLDALFQATPDEVMRMDKLNDQLKAITRQMHERVAIVNEDAAKIFVDGNFEVEGRLNYNPNAAGAILQMENDDYFGSDFAKIHQVIDMLFDQGYLPIKCADFVRASDLVNDFDDGKWETAYEDWQPQADKLKYINICFAIHSLNAYHPYSIPDILRMNNFDITLAIKQTV